MEQITTYGNGKEIVKFKAKDSELQRLLCA